MSLAIVLPSVVIKVGMVGDSQIGKTSLMVKYVEGSFDEDYIQTLGMYSLQGVCWSFFMFPLLGVNFMEKTISVRRTTITFSIWDLGGQREFVNMLPLVCNDAVAILFMFDLSRKSTLNSVKEWYRQARGFNKVSSYMPSAERSYFHPLILLSHIMQTAIPFLIGTKFDQFATFPRDEQEEITKQVCACVCLVFVHRLLFLLGKTICPSNARISDILFDVSLDKRAKDLQDCLGKSVRSKMCHSRDRRGWGTNIDLCRCVMRGRTSRRAWSVWSSLWVKKIRRFDFQCFWVGSGCCWYTSSRVFVWDWQLPILDDIPSRYELHKSPRDSQIVNSDSVTVDTHLGSTTFLCSVLSSRCPSFTFLQWLISMVYVAPSIAGICYLLYLLPVLLLPSVLLHVSYLNPHPPSMSYTTIYCF